MSRKANSASICKFDSKPSSLNRVVPQVLLHKLIEYLFILNQKIPRLGATFKNFMKFLRHILVQFSYLIAVNYENKDNLFLLITERYD